MILKDIRGRIGFIFRFQADIDKGLDIPCIVITYDNVGNIPAAFPNSSNSTNSTIRFVMLGRGYAGQHYSFDINDPIADQKVIAVYSNETDKIDNDIKFISNNSLD